MHRIALIAMVLLCSTICIPWQNAAAMGLPDAVSKILEDKLTSPPRPGDSVCRSKLLCGPQVITLFYMHRDFRPAWSGSDGPLPHAIDLARAIHDADHDGLRPDDYHLGKIESLMAQIEFTKKVNRPIDPKILADLDLLLTDSFFLYGSNLLIGRVNPETIQSEWTIKGRYEDFVKMLEHALQKNEIEKTLENLRPQHTGYAGLKKALSQYRNIMKSGGWPVVPLGSKMEVGTRGERVIALWTRLLLSGDVEIFEKNDLNFFDQDLERGVKRFQERHGLLVDGIVGKSTLKALNVPVDERVNQIKSNTERWRWLPETLGPRYLLVNIADFELDVIENSQISMKMPVVVGQSYRRTPVFRGEMTYMELNPYWHIPPKIAEKDLLPKLKKDTGYLVRQNIKIFRSWKEGAEEIAPESVDWARLSGKNLAFKFRQEPGPDNALGRVKFMFPNKFNVYLHDTPAQELFQKPKRTFSSGCIRVKNPIELATYLLRDDPRWIRERIIEAINSGKTQVVKIPKPIPVYLLYWTSWVDSEGRVHFREDIYDRDVPLIRALDEPPPRVSEEKTAHRYR